MGRRARSPKKRLSDSQLTFQRTLQNAQETDAVGAPVGYLAPPSVPAQPMFALSPIEEKGLAAQDVALAAAAHATRAAAAHAAVLSSSSSGPGRRMDPKKLVYEK